MDYLNHKNVFQEKYHISEEVCNALNNMGYREPTDVQAEVIEDVLQGQDLIVQSKTGSGKTAAFGIPVVDAMVTEELLPQTLVLTPTRELAVQVCEEIADIGKYKKIRSVPIYGKQPIHIQLRQLKQRVHVVVGTPGRLGDLIKKKHLKLDAIRYLVIDEADELLKRGFIDEVEAIIRKVPTPRTTLLFSATMPEEIEDICSKHMVVPKRIEVVSDEPPISEIRQTYLQVADDWKFMRLKEIIEHRNPYSCMIFCNTRAKVDSLVGKLKVGRYSCDALHGAMAQKYRLRAIAAFKEGRIQYLVCTDLAARGIHVDKLDLVINYNVPNDPENYVHRIGRTGRAGEKGEAITFVNVHDEKKWNEVMDFIGYRVPESKEVFDANGREVPKRGMGNGRGTGSGRDGRTAAGSGHNDGNGSGRDVRRRVKKHKDIARIRINAGKKKKVRAGDILGALSNLPGITSDDIGIIDIQDTCSYIEIHNNKVDVAAKGLEKSKVKGKPVSVKKLR